MTSISGLNSSLISSSSMQRMTPENRVGQELQSMVETGEISTDDQDALSSALDSIGSAMQSTAPEAGTPPPTQEEMQDKIDGLISDQVEAGTLTEDQAEELSSLFEEVAQSGPSEMGGPQGGPPPGPPPGEMSESSSSDSSDLLSSFLEQLQEQSTTSYSESGTSSSITSLLFSFSA